LLLQILEKSLQTNAQQNYLQSIPLTTYYSNLADVTNDLMFEKGLGMTFCSKKAWVVFLSFCRKNPFLIYYRVHHTFTINILFLALCITYLSLEDCFIIRKTWIVFRSLHVSRLT